MDHASTPPTLHPENNPAQKCGAVVTDTPAHRIAALDLFSGLSTADIALLAQGARHRRLGSGESLWLAGEQANLFAVIESGIVQIRQMTPTGEGIVVGLFRTGEAIGLAAALEHDAFPADAIAIGGPVDVLSIRADTLRESLGRSEPVAEGRLADHPARRN